MRNLFLFQGMSEKSVSPAAAAADDNQNEVDSFVERLKCRLLREGSWRSLEELFANIPQAATSRSDSPSASIDFTPGFDTTVPRWILENR